MYLSDKQITLKSVVYWINARTAINQEVDGMLAELTDKK